MTAASISMWLSDTAATDRLAQALAQTQPDSAVVYLHGDLGAGKSTLARAWLRALGVTGAIRSPTYTLVEPYVLADPRWPTGGRALHLDLYRIGDAGELEFLALDDADTTLWLVEWPERGSQGLPPSDLQVSLAVSGDGRLACLEAGSKFGQVWLTRLDDHLDKNPGLRPFPELGP